MAREQQVQVLPRALKAWRNERGMSQGDLAAAAGCSEGLIALIETGRRQPGLTNAVAIARAFGVELEAIAIVLADAAALAEAEAA